jgi:cullin 3
MYTLFNRVPSGPGKLKCAVADYVLVMGKRVKDQEGEKDKSANQSVFVVWIQDILDLKYFFDEFLNRSFDSDVAFEAEMNNAIQGLVNANTKAAEYISLYIDYYMRQLSKDVSF